MDLCLQRGDIVINAPGWAASCYCIMAIDPSRPKNPYDGLNLVTNKHYWLNSESVIKVGTASAEFLKGELAPQIEASPKAPASWELKYQQGQFRAEREAWLGEGDAKKRWEVLAAAKPGDVIKIAFSCGHIQNVKFQHVVERGTKWVFVAQGGDGKFHRYPLNVIVVEGLPSVDPSLRRSGQTPR